MNSFGQNTFENDSCLGSVSLPNSIKSIGKNAFKNCSSLQNISLPDSITSIGGYAFNGCSGLTSIGLSKSITLIESNAFENCSGLTSVTIPKCGLGQAVFRNCSSLTSVTISEGVTSLNDYLFQNDSSLISIVLPKSVNKIGRSAFNNCSSLASFIIPEGVTSIDSYAFSGCNGLTSISIPENTGIGSYAFNDCNGLTSIVVERKQPLNFNYSNPFSNQQNTTLYVPYGSRRAYMEATYWKNFKEIIEIKPNELIIGESGFATFCSSKALDFSALTDVKAYVSTGFSPSTNTLLLTKVTKSPAGEGLFIVGKPGMYEIPVGDTDMVYFNMLQGVIKITTINSSDDEHANFILTDGENGTFFYPLRTFMTLNARTAYLQLPTTINLSNVKAISFALADGTTGINDERGMMNDEQVGAVYDLNGQRVSGLRKGVNIVRCADGTTKKVVKR